MKRLLFAVAVAVLLAPASGVVFGKAHVPSHKDQVCHRGRVLTIATPAVAAHLGHGDAFIDKTTTTFMTGDPCGGVSD